MLSMYIVGKDGDADAVYDIEYEGEAGSYEVSDLLDDYVKGALKFKDL